MTNRLQRLYRQICTVCLVSSLLLCSLVSYAAEETIVGKVVKVTGEVTASANGSTRPLTRGVDLFVGYTITTSANGYAQLRLTDDAILRRANFGTGKVEGGALALDHCGLQRRWRSA